MEIQNAKRKNQPVPFINFLFRFSDARGNDDAVAVLMEKYRLVVNAYSDRPRTRAIYEVQSAPLAGAFSHLPQVLLDHPWPNVVELTPEGMVHTGPAMLRHGYCD